jgi:hypothetical protein
VKRQRFSTANNLLLYTYLPTSSPVVVIVVYTQKALCISRPGDFVVGQPTTCQSWKRRGGREEVQINFQSTLVSIRHLVGRVDRDW